MDNISCQESIDVENDLDVKVDIDYDDDITMRAPPWMMIFSQGYDNEHIEKR